MTGSESKRELKLERIVDAPRDLVWKCWTEPEHLKRWFCPRPYITSACTIDLRVGGVFSTVLTSPEGADMPYTNVYLEIHDRKRIVYTDAFEPGWIPRDKVWPFFTVFIEMEEAGPGKTKYTARAIHWSEEVCRDHEQKGFHECWGIGLDQLVEHTRTMR